MVLAYAGSFAESSNNEIKVKSSGKVVEAEDIDYNVFVEIGKQYRNNKENKSVKELYPSFEHLDVNYFNGLVVQLTQFEGMENVEAKEKALANTITEVALHQAARSKRIEITEEEVLIMVEEVRNSFESSTEEAYSINTKKGIEKLIEGLGITEHEYWNEFVIESYKHQIMVSKLREKVIDNVDHQNTQKVWIEFRENAINDFKNKNNVEIQEFKDTVGL